MKQFDLAITQATATLETPQQISKALLAIADMYCLGLDQAAEAAAVHGRRSAAFDEAIKDLAVKAKSYALQQTLDIVIRRAEQGAVK